MKQVRLFYFVLLFLCLFAILFGSAFAQDNAKYYGGSYDGYSIGNVFQTGLGGININLAKYFGGSYDGFALNNISQTGLGGTNINLAKYFGGSYDGFALNNISQTGLGGANINLSKYFGGSYDGFALNNISQTGLGGININLAKYFGGSYDGFALNNISQTGLGGLNINLGKYFGGSYDGFALNNISQTGLGGININLAKYFGGSYDGFATAFISSGSLPVLISFFVSSVSKNYVLLNWTTEIEINNSGFKVERLKLGENNWNELGFVRGNGTTNEPKQYIYEDKKLQTGSYKYRLKQIDYNGNYEYFALENDVIIAPPNIFSMSQNYPNPSNPKSKIDFEIPVDGNVTIKVYDVIGREVITLLDENKRADFYTIDFDGTNLASGVYFYRIISEGVGKSFSKTLKILLIK